jgi:hypothetical protein
MPVKNRKTKNLRKSKKSRRTYKKKTKGGDCGCNNKEISGGSIFLQDVPIRAFYPVNDHMNDPNSPLHSGGLMDSERLAGSYSKPTFGGKGKKTNKRRKQKGGFSFNIPNLLLGSGSQMDVVTSTGTGAGLARSTGTLYETSQVNSSPVVQPVLNHYGNHNQPLI